LQAADAAAAYVQVQRSALASAGLERREVDGLVYWSGGSGTRAIVLLHGINDQAGGWAAIVPALARRYRVIIPDLPGHGESEPRKGPIAMSAVIAGVEKIIAHEQVQCFTLVGNSFGGWLALLYALAHPDRVDQLVLESGGGLARPPGVPLTTTDRETAVKVLRAVWGPDYVPPEWAIDALLARAVDSPIVRLTELFGYFVDARLRDVKVPTTLVWGENDGVAPLSYAQALQDGIPGAKLTVIRGAAHIPHLQQPERFLECLTEISSPNARE
jgi:pimeloyl-ACP methyl ester carboxylesterase